MSESGTDWGLRNEVQTVVLAIGFQVQTVVLTRESGIYCESEVWCRLWD